MRIRMLTLGATLLAGAALAAPPAGRTPMAERQDRLAQALGLTEEQKAAWAAARAAEEPRIKPLRQQLVATQKELDVLLAQPSPDPTAVGTKVIALNRLRGQLNTARKELDARLVAVLTPEQKAKVEALRQGAPGRRALGEADGPAAEPESALP